MKNTFLHTRAQTLSLYALTFPVNTHTHMQTRHTQTHTLLFQLQWTQPVNRWRGKHTHTQQQKHKADSASISSKSRAITLHDITIHISMRVRVCVHGLFSKSRRKTRKSVQLYWELKLMLDSLSMRKQTRRETEDRSADEEAALKHSRLLLFKSISHNVLLNIMKDFFFRVCMHVCVLWV